MNEQTTSYSTLNNLVELTANVMKERLNKVIGELKNPSDIRREYLIQIYDGLVKDVEHFDNLIKSIETINDIIIDKEQGS